MIKINNLNKYYNKGKSNEIHVINDVSIELPDTGFVSILGQSGSGKTTLLNVIGGLDKATGNVTYDDNSFDGYHMNKIDDYRIKNIGYIFQNYNLINDYTVWDNLKIVLEAIGITDKEEEKERISYVLKKVGLYKYRKKLARELSGGQLQRVSIARALVKKSKIIIADEPTGNLDSNNSIEIMNILKKISEKSLVILVTHNKNLADVYSDIILDIVDGKIINVRENNNNTILNNSDSNNIYLKDMNSLSVGDNIKTTIYSNEEIPNVDLKLVYKNGTYYLDSNIKIELLSSTNFKLVDDHYEEKNIEKITEELDYDDSWFKDKEDKKSIYQRFFTTLKMSFLSFKSARPRAKFLRIVLSIIGVILGFVILALSSRLYVDTSATINNNELYTIGSEETIPNINSDIIKAYNDGAIDEIYNISYSGATRSRYIGFLDGSVLSISNFKNSYISESELFPANIVYGFNLIKNDKFIAGSMPKDTASCVIDKAFADRIIDKFSLSGYEALLNQDKINVSYATLRIKISGVVDNNSNMIYFNDSIYSKTTPNFTVKHINYFDTIKELAPLISLRGTKPEKYNEIIISNHVKNGDKDYNIGDEITIYNQKCKITGIIDNLDYNIALCSDSFMQIFMPENIYMFKINDKTMDYFKALGKDYKVDTYYNLYYHTTLVNNLSSAIGLFIATLVLLVIIIIYIYFTMRSKMIADIKEIGTLRSIGIKKKEILSKYLIEIFVTTIFTSLIGYMLVMVFGGIFIKYILDLLNTNVNVFTLPYPYLGILLIFVANIFFGLLPIYNLLKKTPSEIMAKYDI